MFLQTSNLLWGQYVGVCDSIWYFADCPACKVMWCHMTLHRTIWRGSCDVTWLYTGQSVGGHVMSHDSTQDNLQRVMWCRMTPHRTIGRGHVMSHDSTQNNRQGSCDVTWLYTEQSAGVMWCHMTPHRTICRGSCDVAWLMCSLVFWLRLATV